MCEEGQGRETEEGVTAHDSCERKDKGERQRRERQHRLMCEEGQGRETEDGATAHDSGERKDKGEREGRERQHMTHVRVRTRERNRGGSDST